MTADRSASLRVVAAVPAVAASAASAGSADQAGVGADSGSEARKQQMASMADYSRVRARITQILSSMPGASAQGTVQAGASLDALAAQGDVIVPLPPVSTQSLELALQLARSMAQRADVARAAQANVSAEDVGQIMAGAD